MSILNWSSVWEIFSPRICWRLYLPLLCKARRLNLKVSAGVRAGRKYGVCGSVSGENPNPDFGIQKWFLGFFVQIQNGSWIHKIHTLGGFFESNLNLDFWDSQPERFLGGKGFEKKYFWQAVFPQKSWYTTDAVHVWHSNCTQTELYLCWWRLN